MAVKIYGLIDPNNSELRYVGITKRSLAIRLNNHMYEAKMNPGYHRSKWIRSLGGARPEIFLIQDSADIQDEVYWIAYFRSVGCRLTNGTDGGDGVLNPSQEVRQKISAALTGKKLSKQHIKNLSLSHEGKGKPHTDESKRKMCELHRKRKGVQLWCPELNKMFYSIKEVIEFTKIPRSSVEKLVYGWVKESKYKLTFIRVERGTPPPPQAITDRVS